MSLNPIERLYGLGQSIWLDNLGRGLITGGRLNEFISSGVTGITSNPSIFQKSMSGTPEYDSAIRGLLKDGVSDERKVFQALAMEDVGMAADMLREAYDRTSGDDGYVSIEVSPDLAYDAKATVKEAEYLFNTIKRPNILIKVPATKEGLPAIEELISEGINVNATLLFAVTRYEDVMDRYLRGLERRASAGKDISKIFSVASFFVSRVDTMIDKMLEQKGAKAHLGKAAVVNARLAFKRYKEFFDSERFGKLSPKGAKVQKLLWGSTGTKNPAYGDIKYVEEIIGPGTINTIPENTLAAFMDHGNPSLTIEKDMDEAGGFFSELGNIGINIGDVTEALEKEGVKAFADAFEALLKDTREKVQRLK